MFQFDLMHTLLSLPAVIIGLTVHEFSHAYVGYLCGDSTAKDQGRVSFNPLKHIDPIGFIMIILLGFGWAKPVEFRKDRLRDPYADSIKISLAGPLSNAVLGFVFAAVYVVISYRFASGEHEYLVLMALYGMIVNWGLFVFNMLPIPPLDGSHVFLAAYEDRPWYPQFARAGMAILFVILILQSQGGITILPIRPLIELFSEFSISAVHLV